MNLSQLVHWGCCQLFSYNHVVQTSIYVYIHLCAHDNISINHRLMSEVLITQSFKAMSLISVFL